MLLAEQVPEHVRVPYILSGYRVGGSMKEAMFSLFQWHNETMNAWTLLIIPVLSVILYGLYNEGDFVMFLLPLHALVQTPCSVGNHLFRGLDEVTHTLWRALDLMSIHLGSWILCVALSYYVYSGIAYYSIISLSFCISGYLIWLEYSHYRDVKRGEKPVWNRMLKTLLVGIEVGVWMFPLFYHGELVSCILLPVSLLLGGLTYSLGIPERFWPGKFDYLLHGNQILHLMLLVGHIGEYVFVLRVRVR